MSSKSSLERKFKFNGFRLGKYMDKLRAYQAKINATAKNHVSEESKSPGGFPFHFTKLEKFRMSDKQRNERNRAKRLRQQLKAAA